MGEAVSALSVVTFETMRAVGYLAARINRFAPQELSFE